LSAEFDLICACCRWPDDEDRRRRIADAAQSGIDWSRVEALAEAHRVEGLVASGVASLRSGPGKAVLQRFEQMGQRVKARALQDVAETLRLSAALDRQSIRHCILKGAPVGVRAYGTPLLKRSWDIDILVAREDAVKASALVVELGYRPHHPPRPFTNAEFRRWSAVSKEAEFHSDDRAVEVHWGLADHPMLLAGLGIEQATERTPLLGDRSVPTFPDAETLAYLAVHGAAHGWSRLKWLADFAAFLGAQPPARRQLMIDEARRWPVGLALDQALLVSANLLATELGSARQSAEVLRLVELATTSIRRRGQVRDFDSDPLACRAITKGRWRLMPGLRYRAGFARIVMRGSEDRTHFPLAASLGWAYWLMRPFTGIYRVAIRWIRRSS
jgi:hypothetical protein